MDAQVPPSGGSGSGSGRDEDDPFAVRPATDADRERPQRPLAPIGWGRSSSAEPAGPVPADPDAHESDADSADLPAGADPAPEQPEQDPAADILAGIVPLDPTDDADHVAPLDQAEGRAPEAGDPFDPDAGSDPEPAPEPELAPAQVDAADAELPAEPAPAAPAVDGHVPDEVLTGEIIGEGGDAAGADAGDGDAAASGDAHADAPDAEPDAADPAELVLEPVGADSHGAELGAEDAAPPLLDSRTDDTAIIDAEVVEEPEQPSAAEPATDSVDDTVELVPLRADDDAADVYADGDADVVDDPADGGEPAEPATAVDLDADADADAAADADADADADAAPAPLAPAARAARAAAMAWAAGAASPTPAAPSAAAAPAAVASAAADTAAEPVANAGMAGSERHLAAEAEITEPEPASAPDHEPHEHADDILPSPAAAAATADAADAVADTDADAEPRAEHVAADPDGADRDPVADPDPAPHASAPSGDLAGSGSDADPDDDTEDALALLFGEAAADDETGAEREDVDAPSAAPERPSDSTPTDDGDSTRVLPAVGAAAAVVGAAAPHVPSAPHHDAPAVVTPGSPAPGYSAPFPPPPRQSAPPVPAPMPPAPPRPPAPAAARPSRGPRRTAFWVGGAILLVLLLVGLFYLGQRLGSAGTDDASVAAPTATSTPEASPTPSPTATDPVQGPAAAGVQQWDALLGGECIDPYTSPWEEQFTVVDCGTEHHAQMVARVALTAADAYPGEEAVRTEADALCITDSVIDYGAARAYSDVQYQSAFPVTEDEWKAGDRDAYCFVSRADGGTFTNSIGVPQPPVVP